MTCDPYMDGTTVKSRNPGIDCSGGSGDSLVPGPGYLINHVFLCTYGRQPSLVSVWKPTLSIIYFST